MSLLLHGLYADSGVARVFLQAALGSLLTVFVPLAVTADSFDARLQAIRAAFLRNDASRLAEQFPVEARVLVALPTLTDSVWLGPGQLRALVQRLAGDAQTSAFDFGPRARPRSDPGSLTHYVEARWTYRHRPTGEVRVQAMTLALRRTPEDGEWRIVEITALP